MTRKNGVRGAGALAVAAVVSSALLGGCGALRDLSPSAAGGGPTPQTGSSASATAVAADRSPSATAPASAGPGGAAPGTPAPTTPTPTASSAGAPSPTPAPSRTPSPAPTTAATTTPEPTPTATKAPKPKPTAKPTPKPAPTPSPKPRTTLVRGDSGASVLALQRRLSELGYWLGEPDGSFGALTQQAVWALQKSAGISRDGVVGPRTRQALADGIRPSATLGGDGVEIDLRRQVLLVVRGGKVRTILNTSTGNGEEYTSTRGNQALATTPTGRFTVYRGVDGPLTNSLGELWRPRFFHRGIAVHGSPNIPPWAASHGCARLSNAAIDMIWARDLMPIGATVVVR